MLRKEERVRLERGEDRQSGKSVDKMTLFRYEIQLIACVGVTKSEKMRFVPFFETFGARLILNAI